ncbi:hypothetical protein K8S19_10155 [bacterium]|nr:hypothetical protein [bacterium]
MIPQTASSSHAGVQRYLVKHAMPPESAEQLPKPLSLLKLCVVIPAMAESAYITRVLDSLTIGSSRLAEAEVIVLVNNPAGSDEKTVVDNQTTLVMLANRPVAGLNVHAVDCASPGKGLARKTAGVGMARRLGMDLALQRLSQSGHVMDGAIACLDADSPVSPGYIDQLLACFASPLPPLAGLCAYAHQLPDEPEWKTAMILYEMGLRYFELGLTLARSHFAATPIGSCIVVSAGGYAAADGMVVRKAGEDFYFWQKLVKISRPNQLKRLTRVGVFPSARISDRMPFGTSRALYHAMHQERGAFRRVDPAKAFFVLRDFFEAIPKFYTHPEAMVSSGDACLRSFLQTEQAVVEAEKMRRIYPTPEHFSKAFMQWFDGLRSIRFIHRYTADHGKQELFEAVADVVAAGGHPSVLLNRRLPEQGEEASAMVWLEALRQAAAPDFF